MKCIILSQMKSVIPLVGAVHPVSAVLVDSFWLHVTDHYKYDFEGIL